MKKFILILIASVTVALSANAQPRSVGARLGSSLEVSYQHLMGTSNFLEVDAGLSGYGHGIQASAQYNWLFDIPIKKGDMNWYAGIGAGVGTGWGYYNGVSLGVVPQIGLEYIFANTPLQLSFDYRPNIGVVLNSYGAYYNRHEAYNFALSVRYVF